MFKWKRTNFEGFPKIYLRFHAKNVTEDDLIEYRIQDLPEDRFDDAVEFITGDHYLREETFSKGFEIKDDPKALEEVVNFYKLLFREKTSLVCFKADSDEIVSLNALAVVDTHINEFNVPIKSERIKRLLAALQYVKDCSDRFEPKTDQFALEGKGMCVDKKYRNRGIAVKILEARIPLMQELNLNTTKTLFTGIGSQKAAIRAGFEEYSEVTYDDIIAHGHDIRNVKGHSAKILGFQIRK